MLGQLIRQHLGNEWNVIHLYGLFGKNFKKKSYAAEYLTTTETLNIIMFGLGARHRVAALGFFGFFNVYAMVRVVAHVVQGFDWG